jgi:riboflavin kinase
MILAKEGAHRGQVALPLSRLSRSLEASKQTAARRLSELERLGFITRTPLPRGQAVRITPAGLAALKTTHAELGKILGDASKPINILGVVSTGLGEGSYYMKQANYRERFKKELDFLPYPGTLDVKLDEKSFAAKEMLAQLSGRGIKEFKNGGRTFGAVKFFPARLGKVKGAIILPARSHHKDMLEFIAEKNLRAALGLKDGDKVEIEVIV